MLAGSVPWSAPVAGSRARTEESAMKRDFNRLAAETFDLIVVGGGIIGSGIARDAALRGLNTLLLEKEDFAYGTTSRSSRLIHGGLRYLRQWDFHLVRQDLREREVLLHIAPHLVHPLPFVIPVTTPFYRLALALGIPLYDIMSFDKSLPSHRRLSKSETLEVEPNLAELKGLIGSYLYYDCAAPFPERLCVENVLSAAEHSASIINHARVNGLIRDGNAVCGVQVQDVLSGQSYEARGRLIVNAAGHWVDCLRNMLHTSAASVVRRTKGVHLVTTQLTRNAVTLYARSDGRLFFVIPWEGFSLIGTTDTNYTGDLDAVYAGEEDVDYLLTETRHAFPSLRMDDILYTTAGLRSLAHIGGEKPSSVSREHRILDHERRDGVSGFISVLGGKITAYRAVARDAVDLACRKLRLKASCVTAETPLPGAPAVARETLEQASRDSGLGMDTVQHLADLYGSRLSQVLDLARRDARGKQPVCSCCKDIVAQIWHAVEEESALTVDDFLLRRSAAGLGRCQGLEGLETVAGEMGRRLGGSTAEQRRQVAKYRAWADSGRRFREQTADGDTTIA